MNTEQVIANSASMLVATVDKIDKGSVLRVYRSVIVNPDGRLMSPVREVVASQCSSEGATERHDDREMAGLAGWYTPYLLWDVCPGFGTPHRCTVIDVPVMREEEECQRIDHTVR